MDLLRAAIVLKNLRGRIRICVCLSLLKAFYVDIDRCGD
jgi:hypothetical protein